MIQSDVVFSTKKYPGTLNPTEQSQRSADGEVHPPPAVAATPSKTESDVAEPYIPLGIEQQPMYRLPTNSPFAVPLLLEKTARAKIPPTLKYDGAGDPTDHVHSYKGHMYLFQYTDATWCKYFPTTLTGPAQAWFKSLPPGSIYSFEQLTSAFTSHFVSNRRREKTCVELFSVRQIPGESLRDYLGRFNKEAVTIPELPQ